MVGFHIELYYNRTYSPSRDEMQGRSTLYSSEIQNRNLITR